MHYDSRLLGHAKLDATARYTRVATGMIGDIDTEAVRYLFVGPNPCLERS